MADIKVKIGADSSQFTRTMDGVKGSLRNLNTVVAGIGAFKALQAGFNVAASAAKTFIDVTKTASQKAAEIEMIQLQFETLTKSSDKAKQMIAEFRQEAQKSPLTTSDYANAAKTLMAFGMQADDTRGVLSMLADVSLGNSERFGSLALAFAQTQAAGRLMGQEVLQFVNSGFNPLQQISQKTGKSMRDLKKEMEDGAISADMVREAFKDATSEGGLFFGAIQKGSTTLEGRLNAVRDSIDQLYISFGEGVNEGLKVSLDIMKGSLPKFQETARLIGANLGDGIRDAVNGDTEKLVKIGEFIGRAIGLGLWQAFEVTSAKIAPKLLEGAANLNPAVWAAKKLGLGTTFESVQGRIEKTAMSGAGVGFRQNLRSLQSDFSSTFQDERTIQGVQGSKWRFARPGEESMFRDPSSGKMVVLLEELVRNTRPEPKTFAY